MSDPPSRTPPPRSSQSPQQQHHPPPLPATATVTATAPSTREYRKGNWTTQETLTLITAKKLDDERRTQPTSSASTSTSTSTKPGGELRWKWVENYCWAHGCFRSQNQCNDKWDNLLRDYKKVHLYQSRSNGSDLFPSYWQMDSHQRKLHSLPSNMSLEIFQALNDVVQRRYNTQKQQPHQHQHHHQQRSTQIPIAPSQATLTVRQDPPAPEMAAPVDFSEPSNSSGTETSGKLDSDSKRRKVRNIGLSIRRSAAVLAQSLQNCDEKKEKRHQELMAIEQRRIEVEETRNEVNREGIVNLVVAMTNLSGAIQSLISSHYDQS